MSQTTAEDIISSGKAEQDTNTILLAAVANLNETAAGLHSVASQLTDALAKLTNHSRVMADGTDPGHFSMGTGFEYDAETGKHNVIGTAAFEEAMQSLTWRGPATTSTESDGTDPEQTANTE